MSLEPSIELSLATHFINSPFLQFCLTAYFTVCPMCAICCCEIRFSTFFAFLFSCCSFFIFDLDLVLAFRLSNYVSDEMLFLQLPPISIIANPNDQVSKVELIVPKLVNKHGGVIE